VAVQEKLADASAREAEDRQLHFRIGVHVGDVVVRGRDLLGDGAVCRSEGRYRRDEGARSSARPFGSQRSGAYGHRKATEG
jgi:hypothetical protein